MKVILTMQAPQRCTGDPQWFMDHTPNTFAPSFYYVDRWIDKGTFHSNHQTLRYPAPTIQNF